MKKYLIGMFAIVMAIALNSFTVLHNKKVETNPQPLFWYKVDAANKVTQNLGHVERSTLIPGTCAGTSTTICARGYSSDPGLTSGQTAPTSSNDDIKRP